MPEEIHVHPGIAEEMLFLARSEPHMECCGLLAGVDGVITKVFPAKNALASPTAYEVAPQELFPLFRQMREEGLEHLGIYHSHPATDNVPSARDIEQAGYPYLAYFIISLLPAASKPIRAFLIRDGRTEELEIIIVEA
jgi:[CysO sulfur-carrier protein]-S-L-cysteine hydrolase